MTIKETPATGTATTKSKFNKLHKQGPILWLQRSITPITCLNQVTLQGSQHGTFLFAFYSILHTQLIHRRRCDCGRKGRGDVSRMISPLRVDGCSIVIEYEHSDDVRVWGDQPEDCFDTIAKMNQWIGRSRRSKEWKINCYYTNWDTMDLNFESPIVHC